MQSSYRNFEGKTLSAIVRWSDIVSYWWADYATETTYIIVKKKLFSIRRILRTIKADIKQHNQPSPCLHYDALTLQQVSLSRTWELNHYNINYDIRRAIRHN
jgi:hypothetical protein